MRVYAANCFVGHERALVAQMRGQGFEKVIFPTRVLREKHQSDWVEVTRPLLPGYLFLYLADDEEPFVFEKIRGLVNIVHYDRQHCELMGGDLAFAQWIYENDGVIGVSRITRSDDSIRVVDGPLVDQSGKIVAMNHRSQRAVVEFVFAETVRRISLSYSFLDDGPEKYCREESSST